MRYKYKILNFSAEVFVLQKKLTTLVYVISAIVAGVLLWLTIDLMRYDSIKPTYQELGVMQKELNSGAIYALYTTGNGTVNYQLKSDISADNLATDPSKVSIFDLDSSKWYYTNFNDLDAFYELALENKTPVLKGKFSPVSTRVLLAILSIAPAGIICALFLVLLSTTAKAGNVNNKYSLITNSKIKFSDVIGQDEVIADIKSYLNILKNSSDLVKQGIHPPKGILFSGAPGTGKTLLAKAMAGEAKLPFIYLNAANCIELYVGVGAKTIRNCFKRAREQAPCIVFIDELDAIGNKRGTYQGSSENNQTLLQLLQELDGFNDRSGILVIAATNSPESLDPALKRAGRFDREVKINPPRDKNIRELLLKYYTRDLKLAPDVNLADIAAQLTGMTGADISVICNEAAIQAIQDNEVKVITNDDFTQAIDKLLLKGNKLADTHIISDLDKRITAYHEAGHAVMCYLSDTEISRITIQGTTSGVGGFVLQADKDRQFMSVSELESKIKITYAGRVSEMIKFGSENITTGASSDISQATQYLLSYIGLYGFEKSFGLLDLGTMIEKNLVDKQDITDRLKTLSARLEQECRTVLTENYALVERLATALLERETLTSEEVYKILGEE